MSVKVYIKEGCKMEIEFCLNTKYKIDKLFIDDLEIRAPILESAKEMELRLRDHDDQWGEEGWRGLSQEKLLGLLFVNILELSSMQKDQDQFKSGVFIKKAADIQNLAMMIQDNLKR